MGDCTFPETGELARNRAALYHWFALAFFQPPKIGRAHV